MPINKLQAEKFHHLAKQESNKYQLKENTAAHLSQTFSVLGIDTNRNIGLIMSKIRNI